ncbi:predicted protein [Micromonas commoda]|uniref:Uncharacterized protein n=1 Tax=Micromonas commoda (strain RCC299 / NOUM17 / CCMP2709) TaxID=296587 RepID=C1EDE9_MICCC|nr:predicted protein [Micromonas commoda]ACO66043.1 predicted protein [Micromonas commoda]|eukprot:XP_002504785.1 predicted protein [Micromonas commoda]
MDLASLCSGSRSSGNFSSAAGIANWTRAKGVALALAPHARPPVHTRSITAECSTNDDRLALPRGAHARALRASGRQSG